MNVEKHFQHVVSVFVLWHFFFQVRPNQLHFGQPHLKSLRVVIREKVSVHVPALCVAAVITCDDSVWIDDGHHPKLILLSQLVRLWVFRYEEIQKAVDDEGGVGLTRVLTAHYADDWLCLEFSTSIPIRYPQIRDIDAPIGATDGLEPHEFVVRRN